MHSRGTSVFHLNPVVREQLPRPWARVDFPDAIVFEIASIRGLRSRKLANSSSRFPRISSRDSVVAAEGNDATEEAGDDGGRRSVSRQARSDHQPEARARAAR